MSDFKPTAEQINEYVALTGTSELKIHSDGRFTLTKPLTEAAAKRLAKSATNNELGVSFEKREGYTNSFIATFSAPNLAKNQQGGYLYDKNILYKGTIENALSTNDVQRSYDNNINVKNFLNEMGDHGITFSKTKDGKLVSDQALIPGASALSASSQARILNGELDTSWNFLSSGNITTNSNNQLVIESPTRLGNNASQNAENAFKEMVRTGTLGNFQKDAPEYKKVENAKAIQSLPVKNTDTPAEKVEIAPVAAEPQKAPAEEKKAVSTATPALAAAPTPAPAIEKPADKVEAPVAPTPAAPKESVPTSKPEVTDIISPPAAIATALPVSPPAAAPVAVTTAAANTPAATATAASTNAAPAVSPATPAPVATTVTAPAATVTTASTATAQVAVTTAAAPNPTTTAAPNPVATNAPATASTTEKPVEQKPGATDKNAEGEQKPTTPPDPKKPENRNFGEMISDTFGGSQGVMFAVLGGIAGLLLTGGGGIASFLIAGLIALIAAFVGPKIMESFTNPSFDSLDTQGGAVRDQNFKAALLDKDKDGKIDVQEQTKISDPAKLKEILEAAEKKGAETGIKKVGDDFTYTPEATLSFIPAQATPPAPAANKAQGAAPTK